MKNSLFLFIVTCCSLFSSQMAGAENQLIKAWVPTVKFGETTWDFGRIPEGPRVHHEFVFENTGKAPIMVLDAKGGSGAIICEWSKEPVRKGKSASVRVNFETGGKPGRTDKEITITFGDAENSTLSAMLRVRIKADVTPREDLKPDYTWVPTIEFEETTYDFGAVEMGPSEIHDYRFRNTGQQPVIITAMKGSCGCILCEYPRGPLLPGKDYFVSIKYMTEGRPGGYYKSATITFMTADKKKSGDIKINIRGQVIPPENLWKPTVRFTETRFDFGVVKEGQKEKHVFRFTNNGNDPVIIKNVQIQCNCTTVEWPKGFIDPGNSAELVFIFDSSGRAGQNEKGITVEFVKKNDVERPGFIHLSILASVEGGGSN